MCESFILEKTKLSVAQHQQLTLQNYLELTRLIGDRAYIMPVLQGYTASEYLEHLTSYKNLITPNQWVGVGSVCKRNSSPKEVEAILRAIKAV